MKKKLLIICFILAMSLLGACSKTETKETGLQETTTEGTTETESTQATVEETTDNTVTTEEVKTENKSEEPSKQTMSIKEFEKLLSEQPVTIKKTEYMVQDDEYKSLYPDILSAVIQNNTGADIKDAVLAFVAWDKNKLPVKIKGYLSFDDGSYISQVDYSDINLAAGGTYGEDSGLQLDENLNIDSFKAFVVSYETFDGDTWTNPYFDEFSDLYEENKFDSSAKIEVTIEDSKIAETGSTVDTDAKADAESDLPSEKELEKLLAKEPVNIKSTEYVVQDEEYKSLYPDILQAIIQNNTDTDIKNAVVSFVAWDKNGLPVKIKGYLSFSDPGYVTDVDYSDINLAAGKTYGKDSGYQIDENQDIKTFKVIVKSYETFEGETWTNPYYDTFCSLYEGKKQAKKK
jgi:hypothetical protein